MTPSWTPRQLAGIQTVGHSLLVSAAAGSGKTAVLSERCAHLVCDEKIACDVDQLLVVTFTESAAAEMKSRIQYALRRRMNQTPNPSDRLARQIALAEHAQVSTVHGFCFRLLKQNFTAAGIDPQFRVLDADETALLRKEIAADLFDSRYESDESGNFQLLIDAYGDGNDEALIQHVVSTHQLLASLIDPDDWITRSVTAMQEAAEKPLEESELGQNLICQIDTALSAMQRRCDDVLRSLQTLGSEFAGYVRQVQELSPLFPHWRDVLKTAGLDMLLGEIADYRAAKPKAPTIRGQPPNKDLAYSLLNSVKNAVDDSALKDLLSSTGAAWRDGMARVAPHAEQFLSLVSDFGRQYSSAKSAQRALDFSDLERMTLNILREGNTQPLRPSPLARSLHAQFRFVLVDEYQDINPIQDAILRLVSRECISEKNANLFCVGDVKQSIFRFRLAEPQRFLERHARFSKSPDKVHGEVIDLRENFRSRAPLLEAINQVFERLMTRDAAEIEYDQSHRLAPGLTYPPSGSAPAFTGAPIELHLLPEEPAEADDVDPQSDPLERTDYEAILLARRINQILGKDGSPPMHVAKKDASGKMALSPIEPGDIVILLRAMRHKADRFADVLRAHDIEVHNEGGGGLFDATEIRDILALLNILDNQQQDIPLAAVLRSPLAGLPNPDDAMARIRLAYPSENDPIPFHQAVRHYISEKDDELSAHLKDFFNQLATWRDQANKRPVAELIWQLYEDTGYLTFCAGLEDGPQRIANLIHLHQRAAQFGSFLRQGLYRFLNFLKSLEEEQGAPTPSPAGQTNRAVRIMSIHRSKGLEFPVVFLPDLGKGHNLSDTHGSNLVDRQMGLGMSVVDPDRLIRYPSLASTLVRQNLLRQTMAEELRLLYVAMTRAKEHLILIATCSEKDRQHWKSRWTDRPGPLPADVVQSADRVIDWIGPVAAMTTNVFQITEHAAQDVLNWKNPRHHRPEFNQRQEQLALLQPLPADPPMDSVAKQVIERFQITYPFEPFTRLSATASVTSLAKQILSQILPQTLPQTPAGIQSIPQKKLDLPRFFQQESEPRATDKGNATHTVLQYFDFAAGEKTIEDQITDLVTRKLLTPDHAKLVDRNTIVWLLQSEVGKLIRTNHANLIRELPFALVKPSPDSSPSSDALDQMMIRGRIDLLIPTPAGIAIVDYKTDNITAPDLDQRIESYRLQMRLYADAIRNVAGQKIAGIYLVFLTPKRIISVF